MNKIKNFWFSHNGFITQHRLCYVLCGMGIMLPFIMHLTTLASHVAWFLGLTILWGVSIPVVWAIEQDYIWCRFWREKLQHTDKEFMKALKIVVDAKENDHEKIHAAFLRVRQFLADRGEL